MENRYAVVSEVNKPTTPPAEREREREREGERKRRQQNVQVWVRP